MLVYNNLEGVFIHSLKSCVSEGRGVIMALKSMVSVYIYFYNVELKDAISRYAEAESKSVTAVVFDIWRQMLDSGNFEIKRIEGPGFVKRKSPKFLLNVEEDLYDEVQHVLDSLSAGGLKGIGLTLWTQEGIRRYLEPVLLQEGWLKEKVLRVKNLNKCQAAENIKELRRLRGMTLQEFFDNYLIVDHIKGQGVVSFSQFAFIERTGKGNVDKIVDHLSAVLGINKDVFSFSSVDFKSFMKDSS